MRNLLRLGMPRWWYENGISEQGRRNWIRNLGLKPATIRAGLKVRVVEMRGCMGDVRHNPQNATVERIYLHTWQQDSHKSWMAELCFADGTKSIYPASASYWHIYEDGVPEYHV